MTAQLPTQPMAESVARTPLPWKISDVCSVEGEYLVVGGEGQDFGLIASCPEKADAEFIVAAGERIQELEAALRSCQIVLAMMTDPDAIRSTTASYAWAQAVEAERKARALTPEAKR